MMEFDAQIRMASNSAAAAVTDAPWRELYHLRGIPRAGVSRTGRGMRLPVALVTSCAPGFGCTRSPIMANVFPESPSLSTHQYFAASAGFFPGSTEKRTAMFPEKPPESPSIGKTDLPRPRTFPLRSGPNPPMWSRGMSARPTQHQTSPCVTSRGKLISRIGTVKLKSSALAIPASTSIAVASRANAASAFHLMEISLVQSFSPASLSEARCGQSVGRDAFRQERHAKPRCGQLAGDNIPWLKEYSEARRGQLSRGDGLRLSRHWSWPRRRLRPRRML